MRITSKLSLFALFTLLLAGSLLITSTQTSHALSEEAPIQTIAPSPAPSPIATIRPYQNAPISFADLAEQLLPAVVNISSTQKAAEAPQDFPDMPQFPEGSPFEDFFEEFMDKRGKGSPFTPPASLGSGFVIDAANGYIITNNHVIRDADEVKVTFHDDVTLPAEVIGTDEKTDLAVLKVKTDKPLNTEVKFGDSDAQRVGDWIVVIGNPFGLGGTVTTGIVSARQRDINAGPYDDFIQTDASINRGNSGGPMFNLNGEVIGINTAIFSPTGGSVGIGFAIPSALAEPVIKQIIKFGHTRRGWLGVRIQSVTDEIAESLGLEKAMGALVATITKDGPAAKAGIKAGDIILKFNDKDVPEMKTLPRLVAETDIDSKARVIVWRDGQKKKLSVTVGELEKAEKNGLLAEGGNKEAPVEKDSAKIDNTGLNVQPLDAQARERYKVPANIDGILVTSVEPASEAAQKGLSQGDVIVEINQQAVTKPEKATSIIKSARKNKRNSVLLLINREGDVRFVALKLKDDKAGEGNAPEK